MSDSNSVRYPDGFPPAKPVIDGLEVDWKRQYLLSLKEEHDLRATVERQRAEIEQLNRREENNLKFAESQAALIANLIAAKEQAEADRDQLRAQILLEKCPQCVSLDALRARVAELERNLGHG